MKVSEEQLRQAADWGGMILKGRAVLQVGVFSYTLSPICTGMGE